MGISLQTIKLIKRGCGEAITDSNVLILGNQYVIPKLTDISNSFGIDFGSIENINPSIPSDSRGEAYTNCKALFIGMGASSVSTLDISDYENADLVYDLNMTLPASLEGSFDLIIDIGTLEHIFNPIAAISNLDFLLAKGGSIFHFNGLTNRINHGYYMFSPIFFNDLYSVLGYEIKQSSIIDVGIGDPSINIWTEYPVDPSFSNPINFGLRFSGGASYAFLATKAKITDGLEASALESITQGRYEKPSLRKPSKLNPILYSMVRGVGSFDLGKRILNHLRHYAFLRAFSSRKI